MRVYIESESDRIAAYQTLLEPYNPSYQFLRYGFGDQLCSTMAYLDVTPEQFQELYEDLPSCKVTTRESGGGIAKFTVAYEITIVDEGRCIRV